MAHDAWYREACRAIEGVVESVFAQVAAVRALVLARHAWAVGAGEHFSDSDVSGLAPALRQLLARPDQLAVGLGVILQPGLLPTHPLRLEWWQLHPDRSRPAPLEVDLHPNSLNFYDYATAGWFAVPRRTGRRHIVGPYVDVHGTDRYLLTLTMPLEVDGAFLGVAGADVPMGGFESGGAPRSGAVVRRRRRQRRGTRRRLNEQPMDHRHPARRRAHGPVRADDASALADHAARLTMASEWGTHVTGAGTGLSGILDRCQSPDGDSASPSGWPRGGRCAGATHVLQQGRQARLRLRPRQADRGLPELRRKRHAPLDGQRPGQLGGGDAFINFEQGPR